MNWLQSEKMFAYEFFEQRVAFDNPKWVQAFRSRSFGAVCDTCKYEFDIDIPIRVSNTGAANVATEKRSAAERLKDLVELRAAGLITEDEFRQKRSDILRGV
jgi:hypothetical protein